MYKYANFLVFPDSELKLHGLKETLNNLFNAETYQVVFPQTLVNHE